MGTWDRSKGKGGVVLITPELQKYEQGYEIRSNLEWKREALLARQEADMLRRQLDRYKSIHGELPDDSPLP